MAKKHVTAFDFPADNTIFGGQLQSTEQAAIQAQDRMKARDMDNGPLSSYDWNASGADRRDICKMEERKLRGGAKFTEKQMMGVHPRDPNKPRQ